MSGFGLCMKENTHSSRLIMGSERALHIIVWDTEMKIQQQILSFKRNEKSVRNHTLFAEGWIVFFNLQFGLMTAIIVTCLACILR